MAIAVFSRLQHGVPADALGDWIESNARAAHESGDDERPPEERNGRGQHTTPRDDSARSSTRCNASLHGQKERSGDREDGLDGVFGGPSRFVVS
jgi:hypothetical protein